MVVSSATTLPSQSGHTLPASTLFLAMEQCRLQLHLRADPSRSVPIPTTLRLFSCLFYLSLLSPDQTPLKTLGKASKGLGGCRKHLTQPPATVIVSGKGMSLASKKGSRCSLRDPCVWGYTRNPQITPAYSCSFNKLCCTFAPFWQGLFFQQQMYNEEHRGTPPVLGMERHNDAFCCISSATPSLLENCPLWLEPSPPQLCLPDS